MPGFSNAIKLDCTTADTSIAAGEILVLATRFEGQDLQQLQKGTSSAKSVTVSFYAKGTAKTYMCELSDNDNTRHNTQQFTVSTSWTRHSLTFVGDTTGTLDDDNALSLILSFWLHAGSTYSGGTYTANTWASTTTANRAAGIDSFFSSTDNELFITGVQMELGDQATPFEHRSKHDEYMRCLRYLYRIESNAAYTGFAVTRNWSTTNAGCPFPMPVPLRVSPTLTTTSISGNFDYSVSAISVAGSQPEAGASGMGVQVVNLDLVGSFTNGGAAQLAAANTTNEVFVQFDAEL